MAYMQVRGGGLLVFSMSYVERGRGRVRTLIAITLRDW